jgi:hypothetical protein
MAFPVLPLCQEPYQEKPDVNLCIVVSNSKNGEKNQIVSEFPVFLYDFITFFHRFGNVCIKGEIAGGNV